MVRLQMMVVVVVMVQMMQMMMQMVLVRVVRLLRLGTGGAVMVRLRSVRPVARFGRFGGLRVLRARVGAAGRPVPLRLLVRVGHLGRGIVYAAKLHHYPHLSLVCFPSGNEYTPNNM